MTWALDSRVRSAMISDSLDVLGVRNNAMSVSVKALRPDMRAVGLAATVATSLAFSYVGLSEKPVHDAAIARSRNL